MPPPSVDLPQLVVLAPDAYRGRRIELMKRDPYLSRTHAVLRRQGDAVYVEDLGSRAGTLVNGHAAASSRELRPGDVVALADLRLRFEPAGHAPAGPTTAEYTPGGGPVRYDVQRQHGGIINNVGRDQYNRYVQHITHQRESFLREVAATKTKARWLVWLGLLCFVAGFALFAAPLLGFIGQISDAIESGDPGPPEDPFGPDVAGVPLALLGWALAGVGMLLLTVGIVLHIVAASRRKRVDRELPVPPPPWLMPEQQGG
jgi:hypothetical protein